MSEKKELVLRIPDKLFDILKIYKKASGVSYTNIIYNAIVWWLVKQKLLTPKDIRDKKL